MLRAPVRDEQCFCWKQHFSLVLCCHYRWYHNTFVFLFVRLWYAWEEKSKQAEVLLYKLSKHFSLHNSVFLPSLFPHATASAVIENWPCYFQKCHAVHGNCPAGSKESSGSCLLCQCSLHHHLFPCLLVLWCPHNFLCIHLPAFLWWHTKHISSVPRSGPPESMWYFWPPSGALFKSIAKPFSRVNELFCSFWNAQTFQS